MTRAVIFANGELPNPTAIAGWLQPQDFLVAADGGLAHVRRLGRYPHLLIGDLDSVTAEHLAELQARGVRIERYPAEKNETDLELALLWVARAGYRTIRVVAALGGRLDQTLGNLFLLMLPELATCDVRLEDGAQEVFLIRDQATLTGEPGETVSLLPLTGPAHGITTQGLRYPLRGESLYPERTRGISNELIAPQATVRLDHGLLLCIHTHRSPQPLIGGVG
jgi:thiamine pyrophosphokinase